MYCIALSHHGLHWKVEIFILWMLVERLRYLLCVLVERLRYLSWMLARRLIHLLCVLVEIFLSDWDGCWKVEIFIVNAWDILWVVVERLRYLLWSRVLCGLLYIHLVSQDLFHDTHVIYFMILLQGRNKQQQIVCFFLAF